MLHTYLPEKRSDSVDGETKVWSLPIARGIAALGDSIVIGSREGTILLFSVWSSSLQVRPSHHNFCSN